MRRLPKPDGGHLLMAQPSDIRQIGIHWQFGRFGARRQASADHFAPGPRSRRRASGNPKSLLRICSTRPEARQRRWISMHSLVGEEGVEHSRHSRDTGS